MVVYLDLAFFLSFGADALALYVTARLSGLPIRGRRFLLAALLGGVYGAVCLLPPLAGLGSFFPQLAAALGLVALAFGRRGPVLREFLLFFMLSCTLGGAMMAGVGLLRESGGLEVLKFLNWKVFFLVGGTCYLVLSLVFRGGLATRWRGSSAGGPWSWMAKRWPSPPCGTRATPSGTLPPVSRC